MPTPIIVKEGNEKLTSHGGIIHTGTLLGATDLKPRLDNLPDIHLTDPDYSNSDIVFSMLGLIGIGKPNYDSIELFRPDPSFFINALGISGCPSAPTLRQRLDRIGSAAEVPVKEESASLIRNMAPAISPIETTAGNFIPLDIDVSPFNNSRTKKEGVSRTYKGDDGFAPILAYLGVEGYGINVEFREGSQHCQKNTPQFIQETIRLAREVTPDPILMRLDSGNDSQDNFTDLKKSNVEFICKRNLRKESLHDWLELALEVGVERVCREGKRVWTGQTNVGVSGVETPFPITFEVSERTIEKGQYLVAPELEVDTYWCSLPELGPDEVVYLYNDHGTSEQFHSEIKSDLDLERLPSGRFASNGLMLHLGMLSYNVLRIVGRQSLEVMEEVEEHLPRPRRKKVHRRRIRTVMQDLMYIAGRLIKSGRRLFISFGSINPMAKLWILIDQRLRRLSVGSG